MARIPKKSIYSTWDEVNNALKDLAELRIKKQKLEGEQTIKINKIKGETEVKCGDLIEKIKHFEQEITLFAEENKVDFTKKRSKKLTFGTISFRQSKKIVCKCLESAIQCLKALNLNYCVNTKETLDKDQLMEVDEIMLTKAGISVKRVDNISIEPNFELIAANQN